MSLWSLAGNPGAGGFNATLNGVNVDSATAGAMPHTNPAVGEARLFQTVAGSHAQNGTLLLCDRLWHNGGYTITSTSAQTTTQPTLPGRCPTSAIDDTPATTGHGVLLGVEVATTTGAGTPTLTASYTSSAGTAGRSATNIQPTVATSIAGSFHQLGLQAGDVGVRSVQSLTLSATWTSGTIALVAYRVVAAHCILADGLPDRIDWLTGGAARIYDGAALYWLFIPRTTSSTQIGGVMSETHG
jgi:hypothetical protein